ncbi:TIGR03118 family protein [Cellulomonas alba]|uniref:TIGR03118 family protein n=1 Tax=Cellulomonas alba TaxID=3053467 RepID=A0ABT7SC14_9CELL|nr:TIGR03118 family protein [Cellulomonas alba]MDM7853728.1 TIGR03118 family protein [Cellulomonas alba]
MVARSTYIGASAALAMALGVAVAGPAAAADKPRPHTFQQVNLVSDQPGVAALADPELVNAWGMSRGPNTPVWVSDNGADVTTLYRTDTAGAPVTKVLSVAIPGGAPTGQVFNDTTAFMVPGTGQAARFIFIGEDGDLSAWNGGPSAVAVGHTDGAVYKGLALVHPASGPMLLAANFHDNRIDAFDGSFMPVPTPGMFHDPFLPAGYAPFNVAEIDGRVVVTYAKQDADREDDVAGPGHGFVDVFSEQGAFLHRFATRGVLNSPWGLTIAPAAFGRFAGDLLIGNFGDGRIHAFDARTGHLEGTLRGTNGKPLAIDGLWGLTVGDAVAGGADSVWFSAGPNGEQHGLLGLLKAAPEKHHHHHHGR